MWPLQIPDCCREERPKHPEAAMQSAGNTVRLDYGLRTEGGFYLPLPVLDYRFEFDIGSGGHEGGYGGGDVRGGQQRRIT